MTVFLNQTWLVPCPRCKAEVGSKCTALRSGQKKKGAEVMSHHERWKAASAQFAAHGESTKEKS